MKRMIAYIDGYNLYFGLRARYGRRYNWLDLEALCVALLPPRHRLERVEYFTARVRKQPQSAHRQSTYLTALTVQNSLVRVVEGRYQQRLESCRVCGAQRVTYDEKETDVNIAAAIIRDAVSDTFDTAILVSADSDLAPAIVAARELMPVKRFYVALPPRRRSTMLSSVADASFTIGDTKIRTSLLPDKIALPNGTVLERPPYWR